MFSGITLAIIVIIAIIIGFFCGQFFYKQISEKKLSESHRTATDIIEDANRQAETALKEATLEAKEKSNLYRTEVEKELKQRRNEIQRQEDRLLKREESLDHKDNIIENRENNLNRQADKLNNDKKTLDKQQKQTDLLIDQRQAEVERISYLTHEEARNLIIEETKAELSEQRTAMIKDNYIATKNEIEKNSKELIVQAIQQSSADIVSETTVSVVNLPNDDMKGRIIGKEGRNIRTFETLTGIDLIIDDTPNAVILSGFDPIRREIAKMSLEKLINDGRIHPARIEEMVDKSKKEIEHQIQETGETVIFDLGIHSMHPDLVKLIGRLKYKISYGQNLLTRSIQVAKLAGVFAGEINEDVALARRAGLLHEIGRAVDEDLNSSYIESGVDVAKKFNEVPEIIDAIKSGSARYEPHYLISELVQVANKISVSRPGAKSESLESFVHRLEELEEITNNFEKVEKSFAIQAGREIRVIVDPDKINDSGAIVLSRDIKNEIEQKMSHPGHIKVTVIREVRSVKYAR